VSPVRVSLSGQRHDVAREGLLDVFAVVGVHQQHAADALLTVLGRVQHGRAGFDLARVDAAKVMVPTKGSSMILKASMEKGSSSTIAHHFRASVHVDALDRLAIDGDGR